MCPFSYPSIGTAKVINHHTYIRKSDFVPEMNGHSFIPNHSQLKKSFSLGTSQNICNHCVIPTTIFELARRFYNSYNYISFSEKNEIFPTFVWYLVGSGDYPRQSDNLYKFVVSKSLSLPPHWTNLNWMVHYTPQKTIFEHYIPPFQS